MKAKTTQAVPGIRKDTLNFHEIKDVPRGTGDSMLRYPRFDPAMFEIGPVQVRWYGMMYVFGVVSGWLLGRYRAKKPWNNFTPEGVDDLITWLIVGVVAGGRLGYVLFYNLEAYIEEPLRIFAVWEGGMSFHGGLIGVLIMAWLYGRRRGMGLVEVGDFIAPLVPPGLFFGRIGNFINAELWGRPTNVWWSMVFPGAGGYSRHPSQLYEAGLEGLALFILVWWYSSKPRPRGAVGGVFLLGYGSFRFFLEFFREPDPQLGYLLLNWVTMGQILCLPMLGLGLWLLLRCRPEAG